MKLYELTIEDPNVDEVFAISLVESPAIESDWVYFNKDEVAFAKVDAEQKIVLGAILIPNKRILRVDGEGQPYEVFFTPPTIKSLAQNYLAKKYTDKATLEHDKKIKGVTLVESWIKEGKLDKSNNYGLNLPEGTWVGMMKVTDDKIWNEFVKTGKIKGFSIEGVFEHKLVQASKIDLELAKIENEEAKYLLGKIKAIISKDNRFKSKQRVDMESYSDYGDEIQNNAKRGIELNDKVNNKCATQVGKVRAQQLAKGEPISIETIKRMYSYLSRAETYYNEGDTEACGTISYLMWGGKSALSWSRNKLKELGILVEGELNNPNLANPTYPGEVEKEFISPALLEEVGCPEATQSIPVNLANRQEAVKLANYGPLNPNEPNEDYWKKKADMFEGNIESAKKALCANCAFFVKTKAMLDCIASGIGGNVEDEWDTIEAGDLGYCEAFDFKCAASRTCDAWVTGGPITD